MKELEYIELKGVLPFNRFFFRSCYFHQLLACYKYFGVSPEIVIGNYLNLYIQKEGELRTKEIQVFDKENFEALTGIRQIKFLPQEPIQKELIARLRKGAPSIIVVDCFYIPFRADTFGKIHTDHYITVYGYDSVKRVFIILEHESEKDFRYVRHEFSFENLEKAFQAGVRCLQQGRDPFVTFEKRHNPDERYFEKLRLRMKELSEEINTSYKTLKKYFRKANIFDNFSSAYKIMYNNLYWQKLRQMYQMTFVYGHNEGKIKKYFSDVMKGYKILSSDSSDKKKDLGDILRIYLHIRIICKREKQIKTLMLYNN